MFVFACALAATIADLGHRVLELGHWAWKQQRAMVTRANPLGIPWRLLELSVAFRLCAER